MTKNSRVEQLQDFFKSHNKSKEQKAHTSKVKMAMQTQLGFCLMLRF